MQSWCIELLQRQLVPLFRNVEKASVKSLFLKEVSQRSASCSWTKNTTCSTKPWQEQMHHGSTGSHTAKANGDLHSKEPESFYMGKNQSCRIQLQILVRNFYILWKAKSRLRNQFAWAGVWVLFLLIILVRIWSLGKREYVSHQFEKCTWLRSSFWSHLSLKGPLLTILPWTKIPFLAKIWQRKHRKCFSTTVVL